MLWGIVTCTNVDYAELMWEEFVQAIQTFLVDKENLNNSTKKDLCKIPYCRFTKLIICYMGRTYNIHQRSESPFHLTEEDLRLGNLKFVSKGEKDEVFGMQIPKELITNNIRKAPYFKAYLEIIAKHEQNIYTNVKGMKKSAPKADQSKKLVSAKQPKPAPSKPAMPAPAKQPKPVKEKSSKPSSLKNVRKGKVLKKVKKGKSPQKLVDEEEEVHHEPEPQGEGNDHDLARAIQLILASFQEPSQAPVGSVAIREPASHTIQKLPIIEGKGKSIATDELAAQSLLDLHKPKRRSTTDQFIFQRRIPRTEETTNGPSS
ncbi:hypothetical protein Tco_0381800 [Tanacetum coccineum]